MKHQFLTALSRTKRNWVKLERIVCHINGFFGRKINFPLTWHKGNLKNLEAHGIIPFDIRTRTSKIVLHS